MWSGCDNVVARWANEIFMEEVAKEQNFGITSTTFFSMLFSFWRDPIGGAWKKYWTNYKHFQIYSQNTNFSKITGVHKMSYFNLRNIESIQQH